MPTAHTTTHTTIDPSTTQTVATSAFAVDLEVITDVEAPAADVWRTLTDTDRYAEWNPLITSFEGEIAVGSRVTAVLQLPDRKPQTFRPRIVALDTGRSFTWLGRIGAPGVFDGRHHFEVQPTSDGSCRFVHRERLSGVLVPAFRSLLTTTTPAGFAAMNRALAERATRRG
ncbi:MAG TPA: SRPBCC domain-containing protein [Ilumatobacteraceae bacterium]|nr:SRPBCC domain-containing protein [Ilumatobacteraceae bacterium]